MSACVCVCVCVLCECVCKCKCKLSCRNIKKLEITCLLLLSSRFGVTIYISMVEVYVNIMSPLKKNHSQ